MKRIVIIASVLTAVVTLIGTSTACCLSLTSEEKATAKQELKSALADGGVIIYKMYGREKLQKFLAEKGLTEEQQTAALAEMDKGVEKFRAYMQTVKTPAATATTASTTSDTSGTGATSTAVPTAATDTSGGTK